MNKGTAAIILLLLVAIWTKEITVAVAAPNKFEVFQNYPNPSNPTTAISYQLTANSSVSLKVYNLLGQEVASLVD
jgi:hypothetical protein